MTTTFRPVWLALIGGVALFLWNIAVSPWWVIR